MADKRQSPGLGPLTRSQPIENELVSQNIYRSTAYGGVILLSTITTRHDHVGFWTIYFGH
jgi:hypothetical protein